MPAVKAVVLLVAYPLGRPLNLQGDRAWYRDYFFHSVFGQRAYWAKQSDHEVLLHGDVEDWAVINAPRSDLASRGMILYRAIGALERDRGLDFRSYDVVIVVIGAPPSVPCDSGAYASLSSKHRKHAGVVLRQGHRFDWAAHEIGHAIGLDHSCGSLLFKAASGTRPGEYGHPYCIMSASSYGGGSPCHFPNPPRDGRAEYSALGPSVNGATALARGWIEANVHSLAGGVAEFDVRSRDRFGRIPTLPKQAIEIRRPDGQTFVLEYRRNVDWDAGLPGPLLLLSHAKGSTADLMHPGTDSATHRGKVALPLTLGANDSVIAGDGFGIEVVEWRGDVVRVRVRPGAPQVVPLTVSAERSDVRTAAVREGMATWARGERLCVEGTWPWSEIERDQVWTFEASHPPSRGPFTAVWQVHDRTLDAASPPAGTVLVGMMVDVANPKGLPAKAYRIVQMRYEIETLATGSKLRLFNRPVDEGFSLEWGVTLRCSTGSGTAGGTFAFVGREFRYPQAFYDQQQACWDRISDVNDRFAKFQVVLPPGLWQRIPVERQARVQRLLDVLGRLRTSGPRTRFRLGVAELRHWTAMPELTPTVVALEGRAKLASRTCSARTPTAGKRAPTSKRRGR